MIARKDWNQLPLLIRQRAAKIVFFNMSEEFQKEMSEEWHHNNDAWHNALFSNMYWDKDKTHIKVTVSLTVKS